MKTKYYTDEGLLQYLVKAAIDSFRAPGLCIMILTEFTLGEPKS